MMTGIGHKSRSPCWMEVNPFGTVPNVTRSGESLLHSNSLSEELRSWFEAVVGALAVFANLVK